MTDMDEVAINGIGWVSNGVVVPVTADNNTIDRIKSWAALGASVEDTPSWKASIPNNYVVRTSISNALYNLEGRMSSWNSDRQALQLSLKDAQNPMKDGRLHLTRNSKTSTVREETGFDKLGREAAIKETQTTTTVAGGTDTTRCV